MDALAEHRVLVHPPRDVDVAVDADRRRTGLPGPERRIAGERRNHGEQRAVQAQGMHGPALLSRSQAERGRDVHQAQRGLDIEESRQPFSQRPARLLDRHKYRYSERLVCYVLRHLTCTR